MEVKRKKGYALDLSNADLDLVLRAAGNALAVIYSGKFQYRDTEGGGAGIKVFTNRETPEVPMKKLIVDFEKREFSFEH